MTTFPLEDLQLLISDTDAVGITLHNSTIDAYWDDDGEVAFSNLRLDDKPYPPRGSEPGPFEAELARRIMQAIERDLRDYPDYWHDRIADDHGVRPGSFDPAREWGLRKCDVL